MRLAAALAMTMVAGTAHAEDVGDLVKGIPSCDAARAHCFAIQLHVPVVGGVPIATTDWVTAQLANANRLFVPLDVGWQVVGIDALPPEAVRVADVPQRNGFAKQVTKSIVHVFVTGELVDIDEPKGPVYGVTWRPNDKVYVILSTKAWERTLAHELGHVFGLPHSTYTISIMNKTKRDDPPPDKRRFADEELPIMTKTLARLVRDGELVEQKKSP